LARIGQHEIGLIKVRVLAGFMTLGIMRVPVIARLIVFCNERSVSSALYR